MSQTNLSLTLTLKRTTPGTGLYEETVESAGEGGRKHTFYLIKDAIKGELPKRITLTVTSEEE